MDVSILKSKIKSKQIPPYLIFTGSEWEVQKIYIQQISKITGFDTVRIDSISSIYNKLKNKSFISKSVCYIVRDDKDLMESEKLQQQLNSLLGNNILIHLVTSVDKRTKFYATYKDKIIEFEPLKPEILKKYIKKQIKLSDKNCQILIDICESDYGRILLEIDKIKRYRESAEQCDEFGTDDEVFYILLQDGTIHEPSYDAIFDFVDAVLRRKINLAFNLLQQSYDSGESTFVLLSVLYNNVKAVLQVQSCDSKDIAKTTGLSGWQIKNALSQKGRYTNDELIAIMRNIQKVELGIKTGRIDEAIAMDYILVRCL